MNFTSCFQTVTFQANTWNSISWKQIILFPSCFVAATWSKFVIKIIIYAFVCSNANMLQIVETDYGIIYANSQCLMKEYIIGQFSVFLDALAPSLKTAIFNTLSVIFRSKGFLLNVECVFLPLRQAQWFPSLYCTVWRQTSNRISAIVTDLKQNKGRLNGHSYGLCKWIFLL